jgi:fructokinase
MNAAGLAVNSLQIDPNRPTGFVNIDFKNGEPLYTIGEDVAYDAIHISKPTLPGDILYHGTLALRGQQSAAALEDLRASAKLIFMDANLRDPYWNKATTLQLAAKCNWLKINADEFSILADSPYSEKAAIALLEKLNIEGLLVTLGAEGACVYNHDSSQPTSVIPKPHENIQDTIGAGDAFSAVFIFGLLHHWPMQAILARAQAFASHIISISGAISTDPEFYIPFKKAWQTENLSHGTDPFPS